MRSVLKVDERGTPTYHTYDGTVGWMDRLEHRKGTDFSLLSYYSYSRDELGRITRISDAYIVICGMAIRSCPSR